MTQTPPAARASVMRKTRSWKADGYGTAMAITNMTTTKIVPKANALMAWTNLGTAISPQLGTHISTSPSARSYNRKMVPQAASEKLLFLQTLPARYSRLQSTEHSTPCEGLSRN